MRVQWACELSYLFSQACFFLASPIVFCEITLIGQKRFAVSIMISIGED